MKDRNTGNELISVVVPAYNSSATVTQTVESVMQQTYDAVELIIIDDGSTDSTPEVIAGLKEKYPGIISVRKENGGVSAARNDGIRLAGGVWLVTLDADDYIEKDMLKTMHDAVCGKELDLCICGFSEVSEQGEWLNACSPDTVFYGYKDDFINKQFRELYMKRLVSTHSNKLYRLSLIREKGICYDRELSINEDIDFCLRYMNACRTIGTVSEAFLNYRQHEAGKSGITTFRKNGLSGSLKVLKAYNELFSSPDIDEELKNFMNNRMLEHICSFAGLMYYRSGYSNKEILDEIKWLCGREDFQQLLSRTEPDCLKNSVARGLLRAEKADAYHLMCRLLYGRKKKIDTFRQEPGSAVSASDEQGVRYG